MRSVPSQTGNLKMSEITRMWHLRSMTCGKHMKSGRSTYPTGEEVEKVEHKVKKKKQPIAGLKRKLSAM